MPADLLIVTAGTLLAAFVGGLTGFGFGLIASALWFHVMEPVIVVPLILACATTLHIGTLWSLRDTINLRLMWPFVGGGLIGAPFGALILARVDADLLRTTVGLVLMSYSLFMLFGHRFTIPDFGGRRADGTIGAIGGVLSSFGGLTGSIPTMWCQLRGWPKGVQRGVYQPYVILVNFAALVSIGGFGLFTAEVGIRFLWSLPVLLIGTVIGFKVYRRLNDGQFRKVLLVLLGLSGIALVLG